MSMEAKRQRMGAWQSAVPPSSHRDSSRGLPVALVVGLFTLVTGAALLMAGAFIPDLRPLSLDGPAGAVAREAAAEFYAAQDAALTTGDARRLIAAVAPSFVDHRPGASTAQDRTGLVDDVAALRSARPGVQITAQAFQIEGDRVLVYVSMRPPDPASLADSTPSPTGNAATADTIEMVRVAGGVVAERWSLDEVPGRWPPAVMTPTPAPIWSSSRFATAAAEGQVCLASACH